MKKLNGIQWTLIVLAFLAAFIVGRQISATYFDLTNKDTKMYVMVGHDMEHQTNFASWWNQFELKYYELGIEKDTFMTFPFNNGIKKDTYLIGNKNIDAISVGDVVVIKDESGRGYVTRIVKIISEGKEDYVLASEDTKSIVPSTESKISKKEIEAIIIKKVPLLGRFVVWIRKNNI